MASAILTRFLFAVLCCCTAAMSPVSCHVFEVGDGANWTIPSTKNRQVYNQWAGKNRFQIGDSIEFKYEKDSVMAVSEEDYEKCSSAHPAFYSNNGDTTFTFDRSGIYYFISGISGHCERGQKMIIRVMGHAPPQAPSGSPPAAGNRTDESSSSPAATGTSNSSSDGIKNSAPAALALTVASLCSLF